MGLGIKPLFVRIGRTAWPFIAAAVLVFAAGFWLRGIPFTADSSLSASIDVIGAFLSFTIAANTLVRFRGTHDRMPLVLAVGFGASGLLELGATLELFRYLTTVGPLIERARMSWMQSRTLLAETMLLAIAVERRAPQQRDPEREIASALTLVGTVGYLTSALYFIFSGQPVIRTHTLMPRPCYRRLVDVLEAEIERSSRTGRGFSVMLLDLDGLKVINDQYGHQVGSRALRRLADVLRVYSRSVDTAARYGGDEFAIVLPETAEQAARSAAARIRERLAAQAERPKLSVSIGVSVYPLHGTTVDRLLVSADHALYAMKQTRKHD